MQATATPPAPPVPSAVVQNPAQAARDAAQGAAQGLRDQAQALRDQAQALREQTQGGTLVTPPDIQLRDMEYQRSREQEKMIFAGFAIVMVAVVVIFGPIARAYARRMDGKRAGRPQMDDGNREQLQRIEQAVEAMAIEVERISEGQRFTTKLLSTREGAAIPLQQADQPANARLR